VLVGHVVAHRDLPDGLEPLAQAGVRLQRLLAHVEG